MKRYNIYRHHSDKIKAIKNGWLWTAFFFNCVWCFAKGMYGLGISILIGAVIFGVFADGHHILNSVFFISIILVAIGFGLNGNEILANKLKENGFEFRGSVEASNPDEALLKFANEHRKKA